jgi:hypothetical protein
MLTGSCIFLIRFYGEIIFLHVCLCSPTDVDALFLGHALFVLNAFPVSSPQYLAVYYPRERAA